MWLQAPNINCTHGFSTRHGGVSQSPHNTLNLGGSQDHKENIVINRKLALEKLELEPDNLCFLKQVHGAQVRNAFKGQQEGDALVSNKKNLILAVSIADCYPILFYDETNKVIGAAHAGWRGTHAKIAANVVQKMLELGAHAKNIRVAIGQGISQSNFTVGNEVIEQFETAGFPTECWKGNRINLINCNIFVLKENKIPENNIWSMNRCTFENDFFSHRRDKGETGRMWGIIAM